MILETYVVVAAQIYFEQFMKVALSFTCKSHKTLSDNYSKSNINTPKKPLFRLHRNQSVNLDCKYNDWFLYARNKHCFSIFIVDFEQTFVHKIGSIEYIIAPIG